MTVERIFISPAHGAAQQECQQIRVQRGTGIIGDRNFDEHRYPGQNLTLVEAEVIEAFCASQNRSTDLSLTRRNLITRGVRLNHLVGMEFSIGTVRMRGIELCTPCSDLGQRLSSETLSVAAVVKQWLHQGGLRVDVLSDGEIHCGMGLAIEQT